jgi:ubiquinone/menaquinone biosynthesis C-methylase UbiE
MSTDQGYLHGYSVEEQDRLYKQARFLEKTIYENVDFSKQKEILEVGCGTGAQTEILLRRFPHLHIQGIDMSEAQIHRARTHLAHEFSRAKFDQGDASHLPYSENSFDGAFICWMLEHVQNPVAILKEVLRVTCANGVVYCSEVMNATFFVHPYSPATLQYWFQFNDHQWSLKADPFVGAKLANYLIEAGFQNVTTQVKTHHYDNRSPKMRKDFIEYWAELLLSGAPSLLEAGKVTQELVDEMKKELKALVSDHDVVFYYSWVQARAQAF